MSFLPADIFADKRIYGRTPHANSRGCDLFPRDACGTGCGSPTKPESRYHGHIQNGGGRADPFATVAATQDAPLVPAARPMAHHGKSFLVTRNTTFPLEKDRPSLNIQYRTKLRDRIRHCTFHYFGQLLRRRPFLRGIHIDPEHFLCVRIALVFRKTRTGTFRRSGCRRRFFFNSCCEMDLQ